ncbi:DUF1870 family protein (plasmid) [Gordonia pseudamarae]|jgi:transcriptional regulator with XRE-family HTH domain|uniref:Aca2/YdiL-like domain-containing protein n=1 Tax=Gordonia pseudamarae TaxID=2831662 RepID=UPI001AF3C58F|nr:DUF1870 family protein [Gordonia pseudamarae]QHN28918.1 DUF1870 family protein [Gordonia pseudamarae]
MTTTRDRMDGGEFQTIREYLGLTADVLAGILKVGARTIRAWESGRDPIPYAVPDQLRAIEDYTSDHVDQLVAELSNQPAPHIVIVYRHDEDFAAHHSDQAHLSARWWRFVVARAVYASTETVSIASYQNGDRSSPE